MKNEEREEGRVNELRELFELLRMNSKEILSFVFIRDYSLNSYNSLILLFFLDKK